MRVASLKAQDGRLINLYGYIDGGPASLRKPGRIASVDFSVPGLWFSRQEREIESYDLLEVPDGLHLDRRLRVARAVAVSDSQKTYDRAPADSVQVVENYLAIHSMVELLRAHLTQERQAEQMENEFGLPFVAETRAHAMLTALSSAQPYDAFSLQS